VGLFRGEFTRGEVGIVKAVAWHGA
jgi:hypothetical protein